MIVLGIESSCDDTGAAVVTDEKEILGEALQSQEEHSAMAVWFQKLPPAHIWNMLMRLSAFAWNVRIFH